MLKPVENSTLNRVISMSLWGSKTRYTFGALRNAQLAPVHFPGWRLRIYIEKPRNDGTTIFSPVPERILNKLQDLGAELMYVDAERSHVPPMMWRFLVADDLMVDVFIVRDSDCRLSDRDAIVVQAWVETKTPFHCIRDHPSHAAYPVLGGLWGGRPKRLKALMPIPWQDLMMGYRSDYIQDMSFLANAIWPKVQQNSFCHDSVSCENWINANRFPVPRVGTEHLGQVFDAFGNARDEDIQILLDNRPVLECITPRNLSINGPPMARSTLKGLSEDVLHVTKAITTNQKLNATKLDVNRKSHGQIRELDETRPITAKNYSSLPIHVSSSAKRAIIWSMNYHVRPIRALKSVMSPLNVQFIDKSLSSQCKKSGTCAHNLRVINKVNGLDLTDDVIRAFHDEYETDPEMNLVTHFLCSYPSAICELYLGFGKPLIIYLTARYEYSRFTTSKWLRWNQVLVEIDADKRNTIVAGNLYDARYVEYFTGLTVPVIPMFCGYINSTYHPSRDVVLLAPTNTPAFEEFFLQQVGIVLHKVVPNKLKIETLSGGSRSHVATCLAIIHIPRDATSFHFCEHYAASIPIFVPSIELLIDWHLQYDILNSLTWNSVRKLMGEAADGSPILPAVGMKKIPDPNRNHDLASLRYWLALSDFYITPHIVVFESLADLVTKLEKSNLTNISAEVWRETRRRRQETTRNWRKLLF